MTAALRGVVERRFEASMEVPSRFFEKCNESIAQACLAMARRFHRGGRLLVFGEGAEASDAQHVAVEFVHPVIVGKRALPALALPNDHVSLSGLARVDGAAAPTDAFARAIGILGRASDIAMGLSRGGGSPRIWNALERAHAQGLLTLAVLGGEADRTMSFVPHYTFAVGTTDPLVVQETQETLYHVLWELVHVFFEQGLASGELDALH